MTERRGLLVGESGFVTETSVAVFTKYVSCWFRYEAILPFSLPSFFCHLRDDSRVPQILPLRDQDDRKERAACRGERLRYRNVCSGVHEIRLMLVPVRSDSSLLAALLFLSSEGRLTTTADPTASRSG